MKLLSLLILLSIFFVGCDQRASRTELPSGGGQHFQLAVDNAGNAWRLDTVTGSVARCSQSASALTCNVATPSAADMAGWTVKEIK